MTTANDKATTTASLKAPRKPRTPSTCKATGDVFVCNLAPGHAGSHVDMAALVMWDASVVARPLTVGDTPASK